MGPRVHHKLVKFRRRANTGHGQWFCRTSPGPARFPLEPIQSRILLLPPDPARTVFQRPTQSNAKAYAKPGIALGLLDPLQRSAKPARGPPKPRSPRPVRGDFAVKYKRPPNPGNPPRRAHLLGECRVDLGDRKLRWIP